MRVKHVSHVDTQTVTSWPYCSNCLPSIFQQACILGVAAHEYRYNIGTCCLDFLAEKRYPPPRYLSSPTSNYFFSPRQPFFDRRPATPQLLTSPVNRRNNNNSTRCNVILFDSDTETNQSQFQVGGILHGMSPTSPPKNSPRQSCCA